MKTFSFDPYYQADLWDSTLHPSYQELKRCLRKGCPEVITLYANLRLPVRGYTYFTVRQSACKAEVMRILQLSAYSHVECTVKVIDFPPYSEFQDVLLMYGDELVGMSNIRFCQIGSSTPNCWMRWTADRKSAYITVPFWCVILLLESICHV